MGLCWALSPVCHCSVLTECKERSPLCFSCCITKVICSAEITPLQTAACLCVVQSNSWVPQNSGLTHSWGWHGKSGPLCFLYLTREESIQWNQNEALLLEGPSEGEIIESYVTETRVRTMPACLVSLTFQVVQRWKHLVPCKTILVSTACCLCVSASGKGRSPVLKCWVTSYNLLLSNRPGKCTLGFQGRGNIKHFLIKLSIIYFAGRPLPPYSIFPLCRIKLYLQPCFPILIITTWRPTCGSASDSFPQYRWLELYTASKVRSNLAF